MNKDRLRSLTEIVYFNRGWYPPERNDDGSYFIWNTDESEIIFDPVYEELRFSVECMSESYAETIITCTLGEEEFKKKMIPGKNILVIDVQGKSNIVFRNKTFCPADITTISVDDRKLGLRFTGFIFVNNGVFMQYPIEQIHNV